MVSKRDSIYFRLIKLLLLAVLAAGCSYLLLSAAGYYVIDRYFVNTEYMELRNEKSLAQLQDYITEHGLSSGDREELQEWAGKHPYVDIQVYKNNTLMYDSFFSGEEEDFPEAMYYEGYPFYSVSFADGEASVLLYDFYVYQFYTYALFAELMISFLVFLLVVMLGIRRTIDYIRCLSREIGILEGGDLDYPITVKGRDELAVLAAGLDQMRESFRSQMEQEAQLTRANRRMITEMSHDLRTPLTGLMIYTGILKSGKYRDQEQLQEYLDKIHKKAHQIKQLSDHIFEYALVSSEEVELDAPESFKGTFFDLLSEAAAYLEQSGFRVEISAQWGNGMVRLHAEYVNRILDNLMSNIVKYADPGAPIRVTVRLTENHGCISFENQKRSDGRKEESTHIGLKNIENMMRKMKGSCQVEEDEHSFRIQLQFRLAS